MNAEVINVYPPKQARIEKINFMLNNGRLEKLRMNAQISIQSFRFPPRFVLSVRLSITARRRGEKWILWGARFQRNNFFSLIRSELLVVANDTGPVEALRSEIIDSDRAYAIFQIYTPRENGGVKCKRPDAFLLSLKRIRDDAWIVEERFGFAFFLGERPSSK